MDLQQTVPWFVDLLCNDRAALASAMTTAGIETRNFYLPVHSQPCYRAEGNYPVTQEISARGLWLPSSVSLTQAEVANICAQVKACCDSTETRRPVTGVSA
jgi:perosamine synthetase